jgi:GNAT superfamily N-acetyltransferase
MIFRLANVSDLLQLSNLRWDFRMEDGEEATTVTRTEFVENCVAFFRRGLKSGYHFYWIAEENHRIISQIFVHKVDMVPRPCKLHDQFGYITNNYTRPENRNHGVGSALMRRVIEWARAEDLELLIVYPSQRSIPFYGRAGFSIENEVMELRLRTT